MAKTTFRRKVRVPLEAAELFRWHEAPGAFERLAPPWDDVQRLGEDPGLREGDRGPPAGSAGPARITWEAEIRDVVPGESFRDVQLRGPFRSWNHHHVMHPDPEGGSILEDHVQYDLPLGVLGRLVAGRPIRAQIDRLFHHRHRITVQDAEDLCAARSKGVPTMKILVTGAGGLVGSTLLPQLTTSGHTVVRAIRSGTPRSGAEVLWSREQGLVDAAGIEGLDAVVHLAGENIASGRWTESRKREIKDSRVAGTAALARSLAAMDKKPEVMVCASAIGFYGDRGDELLDEKSSLGQGFLAEVTKEWEAAAQPAIDAGIRVVFVRFGVVLSPKGGALGKMLTPFKLGAGGRIGSGQQYMSWISVEDAARVLAHAVATKELSGPVIATTANAVTNSEFTRTLGRVLGRPTIFPMPGFMAKLVFGEMADELLLASTRTKPGALQGSGFEFRHPELEGALRDLLGRPTATPEVATNPS